MMIIAEGRIAELVFFIVSALLVWYFLYRAYKGGSFELRRMAQVDAISDGVDKAVEEGKPIYVSPGNLAYLSGLYSPMTINGMNIMRYTVRLAVRRGARAIIAVPYNPEVMPLIDGIFREVALTEGKPEAYKREDVRYYGRDELAWSAGVTGDVLSQGVSLVTFVGATSSAEMMPAGAALGLGAMVIGGTPRYVHQATWACFSDYPLFCDDIYGAGALCSEDNSVRASILGGDIVKLGIMLALLVSLALAVVGAPILKWLNL